MSGGGDNSTMSGGGFVGQKEGLGGEGGGENENCDEESAEGGGIGDNEGASMKGVVLSDSDRDKLLNRVFQLALDSNDEICAVSFLPPLIPNYCLDKFLTANCSPIDKAETRPKI